MTFNATFYMMKTDGATPHKHDIYDLQLTGQPSTNGNSTTFNGTFYSYHERWASTGCSHKHSVNG